MGYGSHTWRLVDADASSLKETTWSSVRPLRCCICNCFAEPDLDAMPNWTDILRTIRTEFTCYMDRCSSSNPTTDAIRRTIIL